MSAWSPLPQPDPGSKALVDGSGALAFTTKPGLATGGPRLRRDGHLHSPLQDPPVGVARGFRRDQGLQGHAHYGLPRPTRPSGQRIWIRSCAATILSKVEPGFNARVKSPLQNNQAFFRFSLASGLGEMAYTSGHGLDEPSASAVYVRRRASRSVLVENGP